MFSLFFYFVLIHQDALADKKDLELEFVSLKQNFIHVSEDLGLERSKSEKVAVELLNLINTKTVRGASPEMNY